MKKSIDAFNDCVDRNNVTIFELNESINKHESKNLQLMVQNTQLLNDANQTMRIYDQLRINSNNVTQENQQLKRFCSKLQAKNQNLALNLKLAKYELSTKIRVNFDRKYSFLKDSKKLNIKPNNIFMDHPKDNYYNIAYIQDTHYYDNFEFERLKHNPFEIEPVCQIHYDFIVVGYLRRLNEELKLTLPQNLINTIQLFYFKEKAENKDDEDICFENDGMDALKNGDEDEDEDEDWDPALLESIGIISDTKTQNVMNEISYNQSGGGGAGFCEYYGNGCQEAGGCESDWKCSNGHESLTHQPLIQ